MKFTANFVARLGQAALIGLVLRAGQAMAGEVTPTPGPLPTITATSTSGYAPYTVHVHALGTNVGAGNETTARYEWDFGDSPANGSQFNILVGWSAAHTYNQPGTYTITLRVMNQDRQQATVTKQVTVGSLTRSTIYVSPAGNDANAGTSASAPIQTFGRAAQLLANDRQILFQRGGTYNTSSGMYISHQNLIIGAYGAGEPPVINYTSGTNYAKIIDFDSDAMDIIIENIRFDSNFAPNNMIVRALQPHGTNITVRNCFFNKISYAMNCGGGGVNGLLAQGNWADAIGAYFVWGEGSKHTIIGNTVLNSLDEHNIRMGGVSKFLIAHNDLTNTSKSTIWCMLGDHAYVANNILRSGRFIAGPNFAVSSPSERFPWLVFEANRILGQGVVLYSGAENMVFRNNVINFTAGDCFSIWGYYPTWNRTCTNITVANNTGVNSSSEYGKFMKIGEGAVNVAAMNNFYCAPTLNQPNSAGNVIIDDPDLTGHTFRNNIWSNSTAGSYVHSTSTGSKTAAQWSAYSQTSGEVYRSCTLADLNSQSAPTFNAACATPVNVVLTDLNGNYRPVPGTSAWTVGAVELNPTNPPGGAVPSPDINRDGIVNVSDLLLLLNAWGPCAIPGPVTCPADLNENGVVSVEDLLALFAAWG